MQKRELIQWGNFISLIAKGEKVYVHESYLSILIYVCYVLQKVK